MNETGLDVTENDDHPVWICPRFAILPACSQDAEGAPKAVANIQWFGSMQLLTLLRQHNGTGSCPYGQRKIRGAVGSTRERTGLLKVVLIVVFDWSIELIWLLDPAACTYGPSDVGQHNRGSPEELPNLRDDPGCTMQR